ncbi:MAG: hypothetical protein KDK23_10370 [Leptospiraceae bacterium]|nr:hypothetical protein [Leptospiraceae bacterium]
MKRLLTAFILLIFTSASLWGEAIYMRNGDILVGNVTQQTESSVTAIIDGKVRVIPKSQIQRITFETEEEIKEERRRRAIARQQALEAERRRKEQEELERVRQQYLAEQAMARAERAKYLREQVEKGNIEKPDEPISYFDFAWRSAVVPGWGHVAMGKPYIGYTYMALTGLAVYNLGRTWGPAYAAKSDNEQQLNNNIVLALAASNGGLGDPSLNALYFYDANVKATGEYRAKVDSYNYAVLTLLTVYGVQLAHIIYNGFAWEEGLVVHNDEPASGFYWDISYGSGSGRLSADTGLGLPPTAFSPFPAGRNDDHMKLAREPEPRFTMGFQSRF